MHSDQQGVIIIIINLIHLLNPVSVDYICLATFDRDQRTALMIPAKKAFGDVDNWDEKVLGRLCNLLEALPVRDILKLASDVVSCLLILMIYSTNIDQMPLTILFDYYSWTWPQLL